MAIIVATLARMKPPKLKPGAALKAAISQRRKLQDARIASYRKKHKELRNEDRKDPIYREAMNAYQRERRKKLKEAN